ncbi:MAG: hypothetical protein LBF41_09900, partial [Deltaproteobacteria bacterium]|nr:hypothetical protein [Deltaproteobacteria bacterium]
DSFCIQGTYQWDTGGFGLGVAYTRDMSDPNVSKDYSLFLNPAFYQSWGSFDGGSGVFSVHFEGMFGWGETTDKDDNTQDKVGYGLYGDAVYEYIEGGSITLAGWYVDGDKDPNGPDPGTKSRTLVNMGNFAPFLVAYNGTTLGNGVYSNSGNDIPLGHWGMGILGNHPINPQILFNYGVGYFQLANPSYELVITDPGNTYKARKKDLGWEIDVGFSFELMENLSFETQFGYMFNGRALDNYTPNADPTKEGTWIDIDDTFAWANVLAFSF